MLKNTKKTPLKKPTTNRGQLIGGSQIHLSENRKENIWGGVWLHQNQWQISH